MIGGSVRSLSYVEIPTPNPGFPLSHGEAREEIRAMRSAPVALSRPIVVVSGWRTPSWSADALVGQIREATGAGEDMIVVWTDPTANDIVEAASDLVALVETTWPSEPGSGVTTEVDVVAVSMGGLVSRTAARPASERGTVAGAPGGRRLAIRNLYTFATPHDGARLAGVIRVDTASSQMRPGSAFINDLNAVYSDAGYTLTPYAALFDRCVGATRAAPPGESPIWVSGRVTLSHQRITRDRRLVADLLRRLRGEEPYATASAPPRD